MVKRTVLLVSWPFGDRLTTVRSCHGGMPAIHGGQTHQPSLYMDVRFLACRQKASTPAGLNTRGKTSN